MCFTTCLVEEPLAECEFMTVLGLSLAIALAWTLSDITIKVNYNCCYVLESSF